MLMAERSLELLPANRSPMHPLCDGIVLFTRHPMLLGWLECTIMPYPEAGLIYRRCFVEPRAVRSSFAIRAVPHRFRDVVPPGHRRREEQY
jgi:hypothetical protein